MSNYPAAALRCVRGIATIAAERAEVICEPTGHEVMPSTVSKRIFWLRTCVLTAFTDRDSSLAISGPDRFIGRYRSTLSSLGLRLLPFDPETSAVRMRWARATVAVLDGQSAPRIRRIAAADRSALATNPAAGLSAIRSA